MKKFQFDKFVPFQDRLKNFKTYLFRKSHISNSKLQRFNQTLGKVSLPQNSFLYIRLNPNRLSSHFSIECSSNKRNNKQ